MTPGDDGIFDALDALERAQDGAPGETAMALLHAIAPICPRRPDLVPRLLRYPVRHFEAMGFTRAESVLEWIRGADLSTDEAGSQWLLLELDLAAPIIQRHLDELREEARSAGEPSRPAHARLALAWRLAWKGRRAEAIALYEELSREGKDPVVYRFEAARLRVLEGEKEPAQTLLLDPDLPRVSRARLLALLGEHDAAVRELERVLEETPDEPIGEEEDFEGLRGHAGFQALVRRA